MFKDADIGFFFFLLKQEQKGGLITTKMRSDNEIPWNSNTRMKGFY